VLIEEPDVDDGLWLAMVMVAVKKKSGVQSLFILSICAEI